MMSVYLKPEPARLSEYGKRWMDGRLAQWERFGLILQDVARLAEEERWKWPLIEQQLKTEGIPTAITSGLSQYIMHQIMDASVGKIAWSMPGLSVIALATAAPGVTTTGATLTELTYTTYARATVAGSGWNAATTASPSITTNNGNITFPAVTGGGGTILGFIVTDNATIGAGNSIWWGSLPSMTVNTVQTPPTI